MLEPISPKNNEKQKKDNKNKPVDKSVNKMSFHLLIFFNISLNDVIKHQEDFNNLSSILLLKILQQIKMSFFIVFDKIIESIITSKIATNAIEKNKKTDFETKPIMYKTTKTSDTVKRSNNKSINIVASAKDLPFLRYFPV